MSENTESTPGPSEQQTTQNDVQQNTLPDQPSPNNEGVINIATKQIHDVINFQEPSTSKSYSFKTEIRINILGEPKISQKTIDTEDSVTLSLYNNEATAKKETVELDESYVTMDTCVKEKMTSTVEPTTFSRNDRTQRAIAVRSEAPPPYESQPPPAYTTSGPYRTAPPYHHPTTTQDPEEGFYPFGHASSSMLERHIRHYFVKKVFFILSVQLAITTAFIILAMFHQGVKHFVGTNQIMFWVMAAVQMVLYVTLMCYRAPRRIFPLNFFLLMIFTISMSYVCAAATVFYSTSVVATTAGATALICFIVSLLACQTWFDITKWSFILTIASLIFIVFAFVTMIVSLITYSRVLWLIFSGIATVLFTVYLLYDMQCILGGRRIEISPEEYIYGALTLYVDIILIFIYMLQLVDACRN